MQRTLLLVILLAAPAALAAPAERLDALDFDNGALLVEASPSYAAGTSNWSAWGLADGGDAGWCSAKDKPKGNTFVWELDGPWRLDAFAVSTKGMQEDGYPGISAKTVELWGAPAKGDFEKLATVTVGKNERNEVPLPGKPTAARVKVVVVDNHGHAEFTEIAELDLFGERSGPVATAKVEGDYKTTYGPLRFVQEGDQVYGCYDWRDGSMIWGTVTGRVVRVSWLEPQEGKNDEGTATFAVARDGKLQGVWYRGDTLADECSGPRVPAKEGPKCKPAKKGALERSLKESGRAVLYGIRFDTGSDVPRAESQATIDELAGALTSDKGLKVLVEGHTDTVGADDANVDLSNRRAKAVVAALVKKGIDAGRLEAKGFGKERPVADNATAQGRALNRRVEVSVVK